MIYIKKGAEPEWLAEVKTHNKGLTYDDERFTPYKEQLRRELINEQNSCNGFHGEKTCGPHKGNEYDVTKFVLPLNPKCEEKFSYYPNGTIVGDDYTICVLNLDSYQLRKAREAVYRSIMYMEKEDIIRVYMNEQEELMPFVNVIKWYVNSSMA